MADVCSVSPSPYNYFVSTPAPEDKQDGYLFSEPVCTQDEPDPRPADSEQVRLVVDDLLRGAEEGRYVDGEPFPSVTDISHQLGITAPAALQVRRAVMHELSSPEGSRVGVSSYTHQDGSTGLVIRVRDPEAAAP